MKDVRILLASIGCTLALVAQSDRAQVQRELREQVRNSGVDTRRYGERLRTAGIDPSERSLIAEIRSNSKGLRGPALAMFEQTAQTRGSAESEGVLAVIARDRSNRTFAFQAFSILGRWNSQLGTPIAIDLFQDKDANETEVLVAAGFLARRGDLRGWPKAMEMLLKHDPRDPAGSVRFSYASGVLWSCIRTAENVKPAAHVLKELESRIMEAKPEARNQIADLIRLVRFGPVTAGRWLDGKAPVAIDADVAPTAKPVTQ